MENYIENIFTENKIDWALKPNNYHRFYIRILMSAKKIKPIKNQIIVIEPLVYEEAIGLNFKIPEALRQMAPFNETFTCDLSDPHKIRTMTNSKIKRTYIDPKQLPALEWEHKYFLTPDNWLVKMSNRYFSKTSIFTFKNK